MLFFFFLFFFPLPHLMDFFRSVQENDEVDRYVRNVWGQKKTLGGHGCLKTDVLDVKMQAYNIVTTLFSSPCFYRVQF